MFFNQQLREPRVLAILNPRVVALTALVAATVITAGCASAPPPVSPGIAQAPPPAADSSANAAGDLTATEAAVAAMNEAPVAESTQPTAQLIRPDAPMNYTVKRGDTLWDIAAVFLKDPWFWPEIWQINPQVENPHLIYPGDVLSLAYGANGSAAVSISQYSGARLEPPAFHRPFLGGGGSFTEALRAPGPFRAGAAPAGAAAGDRPRRDRAGCGLCRPGAFQPRLPDLLRDLARRISKGRRNRPSRTGEAPVNFVQDPGSGAPQTGLLNLGEETCRSTRCIPICA